MPFKITLVTNEHYIKYKDSIILNYIFDFIFLFKRYNNIMILEDIGTFDTEIDAIQETFTYLVKNNIGQLKNYADYLEYDDTNTDFLDNLDDVKNKEEYIIDYLVKNTNNIYSIKETCHRYADNTFEWFRGWTIEIEDSE